MAEEIHVRTVYIDGMRFITRADGGVSVVMDSSKLPEGGSAPTPMQMLLMALSGCTGMDMVSILRRMRIPFKHLEVDVLGDRAHDYPKKFQNIRLIYKVEGDSVPYDRVDQAVKLSMEKYCSVLASIDQGIHVEYSIEINNNPTRND